MKVLINKETKVVENIIVCDGEYTTDLYDVVEYQAGAAIGYIYDNGSFIKPQPTQEELEKQALEDKIALINEAKLKLMLTDNVLIRCLKVSISYPQEWVDYTNDLRLVVRGELNELPTQPNYPEGT